MTKHRIDYLDVAKGLGIIYVVLGHSGVQILGPWVYTFHMAYFFFLSGCFFSDKYIEKPFELLKNRLRSLYLPYVAFSLVFLLLHNWFFDIYIYSQDLDVPFGMPEPYAADRYPQLIKYVFTFRTTEQLLGAYWFVSTLFFVNFLFLATRWVSDRFSNWAAPLNILLAVAVFYAGIESRKYDLSIHKLHGSLVMAALLFFSLGYHYRKNENKIKFRLHWAVLAFAITFASSFKGIIDFSQLKFPYDNSTIFMMANAFCGTYLNLYLAMKLQNNNILKLIGRHTFFILSLHFLAFRAVNLLQVYIKDMPLKYIASFPVLNGSGGWWVLYLAAGLCLPILVQMSLKRSLLLIRPIHQVSA